jgi:hypothetical protein
MQVEVYLRLKPLQTNKPPKGVNYYLDSIGSSLTLNGTGFLLKGTALKKTFYYSKVYESEDPYPNINMDLLSPSISKFLSGINTSITTIGATGSGSNIVLDRLLNMFATRIYSDTFKKHRPASTIFQIQFQAFEVYGELVRDLLQQQMDGLGVIRDIERGYIVPSALVFSLDSAEKMKEAVAKVSRNKTATRDKTLGEKVIVIYRFMIKHANNVYYFLRVIM